MKAQPCDLFYKPNTAHNPTNCPIQATSLLAINYQVIIQMIKTENCLIGWLIDWLLIKLIDPLTDCLAKWLTD